MTCAALLTVSQLPGLPSPSESSTHDDLIQREAARPQQSLRRLPKLLSNYSGFLVLFGF